MEKFYQYLLSAADFTEGEARIIVSHFEKTELGKGDFFIKQGQYCKKVAFVIEGALLYFENVKGEEKVCDFAFENDWISQYKSLINNVPSELNIQALEKTILFKVGREELEKLKQVVPKMNNFQASIVEYNFIKSANRASNLANLTAKERYVKEISANSKLTQRVPQYYLASYLGIKPQSLSRIRSEID